MFTELNISPVKRASVDGSGRLPAGRQTESYSAKSGYNKGSTLLRSLRREINVNDIRVRRESITLADLSKHFQQREFGQGNLRIAYSTKKAYEGYLKRWTALRADAIPFRWSAVPRTIRRCILRPSGPPSRHLKHQTSGPRLRRSTVTLPSCILLPPSCTTETGEYASGGNQSA